MVTIVKKIKPYFIVSTTSLVVFVVLSKLLDFSLKNTWQAGVFLVFFFGPYWIFAWKQAISNKKKNPLLFAFLLYCLILSSLGFMIASVLFFKGSFK